jgi:AcrR family transcriptional regulator
MKQELVHPTRSALLQAAIRYMREWGELPTFAAVAQMAEVPRRTAYRYFASVEELASAVALELVRPELSQVFAAGFTSDDPIERAISTARNVARLTIEHEQVFRLVLRLEVAKPRQRSSSRLMWFRAALAPLRDELGEERFEELVRALSLAISFSGVFTFRDMAGVTQDDAERMVSWVAEALVRQAMQDASKAKRTRR